MRPSKSTENVKEAISNTKSMNETENKVVKLTHDHILDAQTAAAKSKLNYEEGWNILAAYFIATMGAEKGTQFILSLEKQHKSIYKD
jgi:hypothetical protein